MQIFKNEKGFAAVAVLLIALVLAIAVGVGGYVAYQANQSRNAAPGDQSNAPVTPKPVDGKAAESFVSNFYKKHYEANGGSNLEASPNPAKMISLVQQYGTPKLVSASDDTTDSDPIVCSQNIAPLSVKGHKVEDSTVKVSVHEAFDKTPINFTVSVINFGGLKIDKVTCP